MESKWLKFLNAESTGKTERWVVTTKDGSEVLGHVKWFGRWRGYAFFPFPDCIFEKQCLRDIADFIETQNKEHRQKLKERKNNVE